jgi:hypothetical protein
VLIVPQLRIVEASAFGDQSGFPLGKQLNRRVFQDGENDATPIYDRVRQSLMH